MAAQYDETFLSSDISKDISARICVISTHWNKAVCEILVDGANEVLAPFTKVETTLLQVPGAIELGHAIQAHYQKHKFDAYIMFGCVVRGETPHFDYVCKAATEYCVQLNLELESPVVFGVLTCDNQKQVDDRLGGPHGHKGKEAAWTALQMLQFKKSL